MYPSATRDDILRVNHNLKILLQKPGTEALYIPPDDNWLCPDGRLNMKFFFKDKLHLSEEGYHNFSLYILKILASAPQSFANSSQTNYEYAIGEFEALSLPTYSKLISPVQSHVISSQSFLFCQDDFPCLSADVGSLSHLSLSTWSASSIPPDFTTSSFPPLCLSSNPSSAVVTVSSAISVAAVAVSSSASSVAAVAVSSSASSVAAVAVSSSASSVAAAASSASSVAAVLLCPLLLLLLLLLLCPLLLLLLLLLLCPLLLLLLLLLLLCCVLFCFFCCCCCFLLLCPLLLLLLLLLQLLLLLSSSVAVLLCPRRRLRRHRHRHFFPPPPRPSLI